MAYASEIVPDGYLECDGSEYSSSDYPDLFEAIGTNYGGDSFSGTFKVPDLRGLFIRGYDEGSVDPNHSDRTNPQWIKSYSSSADVTVGST